MALRIQTNIEAMGAHRNLVATSSQLSKSMERLSSGYRINKAADDAAGLAISEKLKTQVSGLDQANRNAQDAVSLVQTAEGSMNEVQAMLQRVRDLAVQYNNGTLSVSHKAAIRALLALATGWQMTGRPPIKLDWRCLHFFAVDGDGTDGVKLTLERANVAMEAA